MSKHPMSFRIGEVPYKHLEELTNHYQALQTVGHVTQTDIIEAGIEALYANMQANDGNVLTSMQMDIYGHANPVYSKSAKAGAKKKKPE